MSQLHQQEIKQSGKPDDAGESALKENKDDFPPNDRKQRVDNFDSETQRRSKSSVQEQHFSSNHLQHSKMSSLDNLEKNDDTVTRDVPANSLRKQARHDSHPLPSSSATGSERPAKRIQSGSISPQMASSLQLAGQAQPQVENRPLELFHPAPVGHVTAYHAQDQVHSSMTLDSGQSSAAITHFSNGAFKSLLQDPERTSAQLNADRSQDTMFNQQQLRAPQAPITASLPKQPLSSNLEYAPQVMGHVQCQLALLYNSYISSRSMYLQQAQVLLGQLHRSCQQSGQPEAESERAEAIGAVSRAVQTAMQIMKASTDVEWAWQYSGGLGSTVPAAANVQQQAEAVGGQLQDKSSGQDFLLPNTAVSGQAS
ncbi:hypothetical protein CEUSTIGMA_g8783.t1 [Chlamydomonas eustigma]|uniref:Uncharacterized protein n=1 Tax=Chlamydomonas eustigma TaxID=1157962 RepID=A0A250XEL0_9CHLO|nr:hypothetical protein CEUSTIGMA_g8783.t1 [Chlamydomonas eustigma]|eukprot:GAX81352.1 hypothetical protein CEUSTIGMA_g8783.t1 [Chlamydomonas eustigma]